MPRSILSYNEKTPPVMAGFFRFKQISKNYETT